MNSLTILRIHFEIAICSSIGYLSTIFREFAMNPLSLWRTHFEFTIFCEFTINSLSVSWTHYKLTIFITDIEVAFLSQVWLFNVHFWPFLTLNLTWNRRYKDRNLIIYRSICISMSISIPISISMSIYGHGSDF